MKKSMQGSNKNETSTRSQQSEKSKQSEKSTNADFKYKRILQLYTRLLKGEVINKAKEAAAANVTERSIQRDLDDLRAFFEEQTAQGKDSYELVYSRKEHGYLLKTKSMPTFTNSEVLAICKILLESRAFRKDELEPMLRKLINNGVSQEKQPAIKELISNEFFHYIEPQHKQAFVENLWDLGMAVKEHRMMKISYQKQNGTIVERKIKPVGIMFSEFYFYMPAFIADIDKEARFANKDDSFPTIYRIDRIRSFEVLKETFDIPYRDRFEEGEFRKRIQFMYGGRLRSIRFIYKGSSVEAVLDRLPTAQIIAKTPEGYLISAEVFGDGIDMWIRSQGDMVEVESRRGSE